MDHTGDLTAAFELHRPRLRAIAYRILGSSGDADDAVQDTWLRLNRDDRSGVEDLGAWLTTVTARVALNQLRARTARRESSIELFVPDPSVQPWPESPMGGDPEREAVLADSVGLAMLVVLETLTPSERIAFVLHDMFAVPFEEIAVLLERSPAAVRQLASRARRRVHGGAPAADPDLGRQREAVDAFFRAARAGDFRAVLQILHPDVVLRSDGGASRTAMTMTIRGGSTVASQALMFGPLSPFATPALVNGAAGVVVARDGRPLSIMAFGVSGGRIGTIDVLADPDRLADVLREWPG
ncbi:sigma-70 family RNA polymerase sigma factor [Naasia lichenicola]|uniref:Sigma-70 family RNA polymerase sigma factor n=1 Tax=Naasia lichenicola TaxID=2565933 RepID=A0A4S4FMW2_9MICO|nr:sigma-70 family RNA polymerase sigma factor [Naasia lichenicola]THG30633.1 sigma-70 family RNA polymerase sigma factor [Naasia lichenicola]THG31870.1 sigma-70 family RNA polymerase sigma factor [Naasia lichenicola]